MSQNRRRPQLQFGARVILEQSHETVSDVRGNHMHLLVSRLVLRICEVFEVLQSCKLRRARAAASELPEKSDARARFGMTPNDLCF
eukprot:4446388-Prymnesium_polylepis.1